MLRQHTLREQKADFVEKLQISDVVIFRKEPAIRKSQMRSAMRRSELPYERQKANLAEPLASKSWWRSKDKNYTDFAKNGVFQQNRLFCPASYHFMRRAANGGCLIGAIQLGLEKDWRNKS